MGWGVVKIQRDYFSFAYLAWACSRMGMSASASFQRKQKSRWCSALWLFPWTHRNGHVHFQLAVSALARLRVNYAGELSRALFEECLEARMAA